MRAILIALFVFFSGLTFAQWNTDTQVNTLVSSFNAGDFYSVRASTGHTYVAFWRIVEAPVYYELWLQILDPEGNRTLGSDGVPVCNNISMESYTVKGGVTVDANDNLYIGVTATGDETLAYVFKFDLDGNPAWDPDNASVGVGFNVNICPLAAGGALVAWAADEGALMQRLNDDGVPVWDSPMPIVLPSGITSTGGLYELSNGDVVAIFHRMLPGINSYLYAQRYNGDGEAVWEEAIQLSDRATAFNHSYTALLDDDVLFLGYFSTDGNRFDSYLQRINPDGSLPWGLNGADFDMSQSFFETETQIAIEPESDCVWAVCQYTSTGQSQVGVYVQKFDKESGMRMLTDNAHEIYYVGKDMFIDGRLWINKGNPIFLIREGYDGGVDPVCLSALCIDSEAQFAWDEITRPIATFESPKKYIHFLNPIDNQYVAVFIEDKGDGDRIYAQNLVDVPVGIEEYTPFSLTIPNPIVDNMVVTADVPIRYIEVFNAIGRCMVRIDCKGQRSIEIGTRNWAPGLYIVGISSEQGTRRTMKLIKR